MLYIQIKLFECILVKGLLLMCQWSCPQQWCWNESWQWACHAAPSGHALICAVTAYQMLFGTLYGLFKVHCQNRPATEMCVSSATLGNVIFASSFFLSIFLSIWLSVCLFSFYYSFLFPLWSWPCNARRHHRIGLTRVETTVGDGICCIVLPIIFFVLLLILCYFDCAIPWVYNYYTIFTGSDAHIWLFLSDTDFNTSAQDIWSNTSALVFPKFKSVYLTARELWRGQGLLWH